MTKEIGERGELFITAILEPLHPENLRWLIKRFKRLRRRHIDFSLNGRTIAIPRKTTIELTEKILAEKGPNP